MFGNFLCVPMHIFILYEGLWRLPGLIYKSYYSFLISPMYPFLSTGGMLRMSYVEKHAVKLLNRHEMPLLFSLFFLLVVLKAILTFPFTTPWIIADEVVYSKLSQSLLDLVFISDIKNALTYSPVQTYPPGYSIFLSVTNFLSPDKQALYQNMLLVNSFLSSSIIFPAYFLLKKYTSKFQALSGSLVISTLPSVTTYTFVLMSENLFVPLVLYSVWFLHESFENNDLHWNVLAGISIFYLYFTKETGIVFIFSVLISLVYFFVLTGCKDRSKLFRNKAVLVFSLAMPTFGWLLYKIAALSKSSLYDTAKYSSSLVDCISQADAFELFVRLVLNEIGYIMLSAYIFIFIICALLVSESIFRLKLIGFSEYTKEFDLKKVTALNSSIVYFISFSAGLLLITVAHMNRYIANPENFIFGRYIDPIIPVVFLFGLIGIAVLQMRSNGTATKRKYRTIMFSSFIVLPCLYYLPHTYYGFPNMFGIYYVIYLQKYMSYFVLLLLIALFFLIIPFYLMKRMNNGKPITLFFTYLILLSIVLSVPTYEEQFENMNNTKNINQIGRYLEHNSSDDTLILMDHEDVREHWGLQMWFFIQYWTDGEMVQHFTNDDPSGLATKEHINDVDYIISKKLLPYHCVETANNGYKLYDLTVSSQTPSNMSLPYIIDIGKNDQHITEGFYDPELGEYRWTTNSSKIKIEYGGNQGPLLLEVMMRSSRPDTDPANVTLYMNGNLIGSAEKIIGNRDYSVVVPENYLEDRYQILEIRTNTWKPSDHGYVNDDRDLGIQIDWIKIDSLSNGATDYITATYG